MVKEPKGTPVVKAAIDKIKVNSMPALRMNTITKILQLIQIAADVRRTNDKDFTLPEVELCISIRALSTVDQKTRVRQVCVCVMFT